MFIFGNILAAIAQVLGLLLDLYMWVLIISALLSWVRPDPYSPIVRFLYQVTEPVLRRIRKVIPAIAGGIDFSPMIAILVIYFLRAAVVPSLFETAMRLKQW